MKDILKTGDDKELTFNILYNDDDQLFQRTRTTVTSGWTSRTDSLSWLIKHYGSVIDILYKECRTKQMTEIVPMQGLTN